MKRFAPSLPLLILTALFTVHAASAQAPPATDLWLVELTDPMPTPINLTDRDGYDNQPFFTPDGQVLYTSFRDGQTDIYRLDPMSGKSMQVTATPESEYSPTLLPSGDGFSVIRVEADGTQRLWRFDTKGQHPALVFDAIKPVGYHAWADSFTVAMFILGEPTTLQHSDTRKGIADTLAHRVGRSLHRIPGTTTISFVHKETDDAWTIKTLDPATGTITPITATLPGREDYAWRPDGTLLMADGPILYHWTPSQGTWHPLADFSTVGITAISRLSVSPDGTHLVFVSDRGES